MKLARLRLGGHVDRYVGSLFLASYATALLLVVGLAVILDMASHIDYFEPWPDGSAAPATLILRYYLLNVPFLFLQVAPFVTVTAALFTASRLVKSNEVVAVLGAGASAHRLLLPLLAGATLAAVGMFGLREGATNWLGYERDGLREALDEKRWDRVYDHVWLRTDDGAVVRMDQFRPSTGSPPRAEGLGLIVVRLVDGRWIEQVATRATWAVRDEGPGWLLTGGLLREEEGDGTSRPVTWLEDVEFTPDDVLAAWRGREQPLELSFSEVLELCQRDPDNQELQTLLQYHLTFPLANLVLLLVTVPFMMSHRRSRGAESLAASALMCVAYFGVDFIARSLGMEGVLGPMVASWLPVLLFGSLGAVVFEGMSS